jgi:hypothetical protein
MTLQQLFVNADDSEYGLFATEDASSPLPVSSTLSFCGVRKWKRCIPFEGKSVVTSLNGKDHCLFGRSSLLMT